MPTPLSELIAIVAEADQLIATSKNTVANPSASPVERVRALLDMAALKTTQANTE
jgi:hypothetical protein